MGKGNLNYLHTFDEISKIYNIDSSTIRKQVAQGKYIIGKDVKKFGKTWIMTEECMVRTFGEHMYIKYLQELENQIKNTKALASVKKSKMKKSEANLDGNDDDDFKDTWNEDVQGITLQTFSFGDE